MPERTKDIADGHEPWCAAHDLDLCSGCAVKYGWHYDLVTDEETTCRDDAPHHWLPKPCNCGPNDRRTKRRRAADEALRTHVATLADELEAEVKARYGDDIHPSQMRRFERDMEPVAAARRALGDSG